MDNNLINQLVATSSPQIDPHVSAPQRRTSAADDLARYLSREQGSIPNVSGRVANQVKSQMEEINKRQEAAQEEQTQEQYQPIVIEPQEKQQQGPGGVLQNIVNMIKPLMGEQDKVLEQPGVVTQKFGNRSSVERFSGGVNYGTDIAVPKGTKVAAPPGEWKVVDAFSSAQAEGPNNRQRSINSGYGNSVLLQNTQTGEKVRYSHLTMGGVGVKPGQVIKGGQVVGLTGATGNTAGRTGQHLDLEYYDSNGKIRDVMKSPYARYLF